VDRHSLRRTRELGDRLIKRRWRREGLLVSQKRVIRRRIGKGVNGFKRRQASMKNEVWGMDFVQERIADGRPFRMLVADARFLIDRW
jgi:transposase InsO family protein